MSNIYYFGCRPNEAGHHLWLPGYRMAERHLPEDFPFDPTCLDGGFLRHRPYEGTYKQGHGKHFWICDWTVITFWDQSGDSRPASNSAFVLRGSLSPGDTMRYAAEHFSEVCARIKFPLVIKSNYGNQTIPMGGTDVTSG